MEPLEANSIEIRRLADCTFRQAVELWNLGFSGYYSDMSVTLEQFVTRLGRESIRPDLSVAAFAGEEPAGFVLVAKKTVDGVGIVWNGGTGVSPSQRGKGLAKLLMREAVEAMRESGASTGLLEVVQKNAGAIAAYESAGFRIRDGLIGAKRSGTLAGALSADLAAAPYPIGRAKPKHIAKLPFFRKETAWSPAWFNNPDADGIILFDQNGAVGAYAIVRRTYADSGKLTGITLLQCSADPARADRKELLHAALAAAFGPFEEDCVRLTDNVSMADDALVEWLDKAGFETVYTQYLMTVELKG
ncbi:GNAT family N-acetyltransferase [Paenibacillus hodogayensis]|uniref:GNAT family N-acetyltransferase n=1 Tax=Paenibacillus hodogayensis TaxID=279208 RepID=A0ABV5VNZ4_9BACL